MTSTHLAPGASSGPPDAPTLADIQAAHARISDRIHRTPLLTSRAIDALATQAIFGDCSDNEHRHSRIRIAFKAEHLQRVGAFKFRGASNAVLRHLEAIQLGDVDDESSARSKRKLALVTHSSGNHAAALACAATQNGAVAHVVMPNNAPQVKQTAVRGYGAVVHLCEPTLAARESTANRVLEDLRAEGFKATFVHPYDEPWVIEGQGTLALEMHDQVQALEHRPGCSYAASTGGTKRENAWSKRDAALLPRWDFVIGPVGGGGMMSGSSTALKGLGARIDVRAAEPLGADDASRSFESGNVEPAIVPAQTICDGLLTALSPRTLSILQRNVSHVHLVNDASTLRANRLLLERVKQVVEPSAATSLAVVLSNQDFARAVREKVQDVRRATVQSQHSNALETSSEQTVEIRIGCILTGGNVELAKLIQAMDRTAD